jgi:hypothetical protein
MEWAEFRFRETRIAETNKRAHQISSPDVYISDRIDLKTYLEILPLTQRASFEVEVCIFLDKVHLKKYRGYLNKELDIEHMNKCADHILSFRIEWNWKQEISCLQLITKDAKKRWMRKLIQCGCSNVNAKKK